MKPIKFKNFLLTEQNEYLAHRIADVLTSVHELVDAKDQLGAKMFVRQTEVVVNQMRKILHTSWPRSDRKYLKVLQKCGVALMKAVEEKGDLPETFVSVKSELEKLTGKLGKPVSNVASNEEDQPQPEPTPPPGQQEAPPPPPPTPGQ